MHQIKWWENSIQITNELEGCHGNMYFGSQGLELQSSRVQEELIKPLHHKAQ